MLGRITKQLQSSPYLITAANIQCMIKPLGEVIHRHNYLVDSIDWNRTRTTVKIGMVSASNGSTVPGSEVLVDCL